MESLRSILHTFDFLKTFLGKFVRVHMWLGSLTRILTSLIGDNNNNNEAESDLDDKQPQPAADPCNIIGGELNQVK